MAYPAVPTSSLDADVEVPLTPSTGPEPAAEELILDDELLVEDVSIDGMCGVY
jgi:mycofactocin precursor